ncbi:MAG: hypothetical protein LUH58_08905, partial [Lachnospiraceae bacterium]|nr:hypothetical protein [Lachnospiraceae bacterium]
MKFNTESDLAFDTGGWEANFRKRAGASIISFFLLILCLTNESVFIRIRTEGQTQDGAQRGTKEKINGYTIADYGDSVLFSYHRLEIFWPDDSGLSFSYGGKSVAG